MKILLTGGTGFIGAAFARKALEGGHEVGLLTARDLPENLTNQTGVTRLPGTLQNAPWLEIERFKAEACVHSAWVTTPGVYLESPENLEFLDRSLRFLEQVQVLGTRQILGLGTCIEYQSSRTKLNEATSAVAPTTLYAKCKNDLRLALEARARASKGGLFVAWGRVFYPYGPGEHSSRLCSALIKKLKGGEAIELKTPNATKDYIYIDDLAAAILKVVEARFAGTINLGTGEGVTVKALAEKLAEKLGRQDLVHVIRPAQDDPLGDVVADATRLRGLGWEPKWSLDAGVQALIESGGPV